jgi:tetraacyldisaccharide 4'-kinase
VAAGWRPGVVSRGHGRSSAHAPPHAVHSDSQASAVGDEPLLLARRGQVPVWVGRDRAAAGAALLGAHPEVNVLLCDDGLQHLRLARDLEIIVFDERGAGNGWLLPAGPLREPIDIRSDVAGLVLYNAAAPSTALPGHLLERGLAGAVALGDWWAGVAASRAALHALRGRPVLVCAGVGQPQRFAAMLRGEGVATTVQRLADHYDFAALPWPVGTPDVLVTEKDAVKLDPQRVAAHSPGTRVWVVPLKMRWPPAALHQVLDTLARLKPSRPSSGALG